MISTPSNKPAQEKNQSPESTGKMGITYAKLQRWLRASCWHGEFFCDHAQTAGTVQKTARELNKLKLEDKHHSSKKNVERVCGASDYQAVGLTPGIRDALGKGGAA